MDNGANTMVDSSWLKDYKRFREPKSETVYGPAPDLAELDGETSEQLRNALNKFFNQKSNKMQSTIVEVECTSKKASKNYDPAHPVHTAIELSVPYDQNSIFFQMSGGTVMTLNTVNQDAADMFVLGGKYKMEISPVEVAE